MMKTLTTIVMTMFCDHTHDIHSYCVNKEIDVSYGVYNYHNKYSYGKDCLNIEDFMGVPVLSLKSKTSWDPIPDVVLKTVWASCMQCF
jgi:hypothetical protein